MTYKLDQAKNKLTRLKKEQAARYNAAQTEGAQIPLGQPNIIGRGDIYKNVKRNYEKAFQLEDEIKKQKSRVEMLEKVETVKSENDLLKDVHVVGRSKYATVGAKTSVNNLEYFKDKLTKLEASNEKAKAHNKVNKEIKAKTYGAEITQLKRKIEMLEKMKEKSDTATISEKAQKLIDNGAVRQWQKKPIYYFVQGLRKVALELNAAGDFEISRRYPAYSDDDKEFVNELLK